MGAPPARLRLERRALVLLTAGFFLTGLTALSAEVVLNRLLRYVFGSSHQATATVLAAYMSGLSTGAWLFGRVSGRIRRKLAAYGFLELAVALFFACAPALYLVFRDVGQDAASALSERPALLAAARFTLSFLFVFVPTLFMGGTLPVLLGALSARDALGRQLPRLYAANTLGAAAGTLVGAYLLMPRLGLDGALLACALIDCAVAVVALGLSSRLEPGAAPDAAGSGPPAAPPPTPDAAGASLPERALLPLAFAQGAVVFALEVVWTHLVGTVVGVTVYAFAVMLAAILFGIGVGSALLPWLRSRLALGSAALFVLLEAGVALTILLTLPIWDRFPDVIGALVAAKPLWSFWERELVRFLFCALLMLPVTALTGAALPALAAAAARPEQPGRLVGRLFAANTAGAICGSLATGFLLLGRIDSETLLRGAAALALAVAVTGGLLLRPSRAPVARPLAAAAALTLCGIALAPGWNRSRLTAGSHYYWTPWQADAAEIRYFREDAQVGFVTVEQLPSGTQVMKTNGKYESNDEPVEFQDFLGLIGASYLTDFGDAFLLGLGPGRTLAMAHELPFRRIDVAEFSPAVLDAARRHFARFVAEPLRDPRVHVHVDDGRNRLQVSRRRYSLVVVAITGAAFAGNGSLYSRDFFELVSSRLEPGGVFLMWLQLHHVPELAVRSTLLTLRRVFPALHVYVMPGGGQAYLVASPWPLRVRRSAIRAVDQGARARRSLAGWKLYSSEGLASLCALASDAEIERYVRSGPRQLYTDLDPAFEFVAPYGLALPIPGHDLHRWSSGRLPEFDPPLSEGEAAGLQGLRLQSVGDYRGSLLALEAAERLLGRSRFSPYLWGLRRAQQQAAPQPPP